MTTPYSFIKGLTSSNIIIPAFNFSPIMDIINGEYVVGTDQVTYLNGGLCGNNAVTGGNNTQKTGFLVLAMCRMLVRFPSSIVVFFDIEATFSVQRLARQVDREIGIPGYFFEHILNKRFFYYSRNDGCDGSFVHNWFKDADKSIRQDIKEKKAVKIKLPFPDNNGNPMEVYAPIVTCVDSLSEMQFYKTSANYQEGDVDDGGEKNRRDMVIGNQRRIVYEDCDVLGGALDFVQLWTAQVVDVINMTGRPQEKESVFIRPGKKLKGPKSLLRLPQTGYEIIKGSQLKNGQDWMYPDPYGKDVFIDKDAKENPDLLYYPITPYRNKSGASGGFYSFIGSQSLGIQEGLSMYHTCKTSEMFGLEGSAITHASVLYPECKVGRTTIRAKLYEDEKLQRALTIQYQMCHMQRHWLDMNPKYRISPDELYVKIKEQGYDWDDILENTVDYYHQNPDIKKHPLSTMELLKIALGERKPYWIK